jgi:two-component system catabolic regulation response regulator CreB
MPNPAPSPASAGASARPLVLIVDDEPGIADIVAYTLARDGFEPRVCATASAALAACAEARPALAILDIGLPDMSGFDLFKALAALPGGGQLPMLFLTARSDEIDRVVGLELGADDYIAKPFSPRELSARVRTILRRARRQAAADLAMVSQAASPLVAGVSAVSGFVDPAQAPAVPPALQVDDLKKRVHYYGQPLELSRYEYGLIKTLAAHPGRVYSRDELLAHVWDDPVGSLERTVDAHIKTLRAKLKQVAPEVEPIRTQRGMGYALEERLPPRPPAARAG